VFPKTSIHVEGLPSFKKIRIKFKPLGKPFMRQKAIVKQAAIIFQRTNGTNKVQNRFFSAVNQVSLEKEVFPKKNK